MIRLNLGCGSQLAEGWINVDYSVGARFSKIPFFHFLNRKFRLFDMDWNKQIYLHDLTKTFPWSDSTVDVIYSSHTLEHFSKTAGRNFLTECHRVLRRDGIIRIIVPDLRWYIFDYLEGGTPADEFVEKLGVLYESDKSSIKSRLAPFLKFPHKCMYDGPRLQEILNDIGFDASTRPPFDSDISGISQIEIEKRTKNAVIVEGRKL